MALNNFQILLTLMEILMERKFSVHVRNVVIYLWNRRNVVYHHLICHGFVKGYTRWINHGEWDIKLNVDDDMDQQHDDIDGLLNDQFRDVAYAGGVYDGPNEDAKKFYSLLEEANQELYSGCIGFSKL